MFKLSLIAVLVALAVAFAAPAEETGDEIVNDATCTSQNCVEPACRCWNSGVPKGFPVDNIPQIVFLSFDESVTISNYANYTTILGTRKNPNDCPISMTFFATHDYTNYAQLNALYKRGSEVALHSLRGSLTNTDYWKEADEETWFKEVDGLRTIISTYANIPKSSINGFRAPFLQPGGDIMVNALKRAGAGYDASYHTREHTGMQSDKPALWPYTRNHLSGQDCQNPPCIAGAHPGFWTIPMVDLFYNESVFCSMADQCGSLKTKNEQFQFLMENFNRHYKTNRAPFGVYAHSAWFQANPHLLEGYTQFLDEILAFSDVYVVSLQKGLAWMKSPTSLDDIAAGRFAPWLCPPLTSPCRTLTCEYLDVAAGGDRIFSHCSSFCPNNYPWYENPTGI